jgi:branched-chain amino acid transport system ATP-binding protein
MSNPKLIMMDEPSIGLAPIIVDELVPVIKNINQKGISVLLIEQNVPLALEVAHYVYALQLGKIVLSSEGEDLKSNDIIKEAYLGG